VQQRLTFKPNSKGENTAPVVFQYDPNGDLINFVLELRSALPAAVPEETRPAKDSRLAGDEDFDADEISKTFFVEPKAERIFRQQKEAIKEWITGVGEETEDSYQPPRVTENHRHPLELYCQLTDDEFLYVQELESLR
jgi:hypothetical protein